MEEKTIKHYSSSQKILLVGEGDFSFSLSLAKAFGSASNMVATSLDSKGILLWKYPRVSIKLMELEELGCTILHEVDVHTMSEHPLLKTKCFDRIIFNFPHAGFTYREHKLCQIELHQKLVSGFFKSAKKMITQNGEIHVTHKNGNPYNKWEVVELAVDENLQLVEKVRFRKRDYLGYVNKRGSGNRCDKTFAVGDCSTFKFSHASQDNCSLIGLEDLFSLVEKFPIGRM
ncbi:uncharacterized protein At4g26485-like [Vigna unguiculata]|uniref:uncharacterized protein At4g26485-like n=1 Tax=Vigna unguiculata TaxID=3917 RepID=UPI001016B23C|nr:uncharacterized protein At4g26485-like [Vigna unguiculata]